MVVAVGFALLVAACGGDDDSTSEDSEGPEAAAAKATVSDRGDELDVVFDDDSTTRAWRDRRHAVGKAHT